MGSHILSSDELARLQPDSIEPLASAPDPSLLQLLASIERSQLDQLMSEHYYQPGTIICREGDEGNAMYLIWSGRVAVVKGDFESPTILGYRGPGEIIGEMALLESRPRSATNVALDDVRLLRIDRALFQEWVSSTPAIGMSIMAMLSARLRASDTARRVDSQVGRQLVRQVNRLQSEKEQLLELQSVRQETSDLIVHDLRNPLGVIAGVLNMLEMVLPQEALKDNRQLLDLATAACGRMQRLVDSLLDVAKLDTGEMQLQLVTVALPPLLEDAGKRQHLSMTMRNITLHFDIEDDLPPVTVDVDMLDRVLGNLLDNALKYTPDKGWISIGAHRDSKNILVSVTDTGPGIPPDERERIFERFAQVADGPQPVRRGFGLGLTFCRLAVEAHGGQIWIEPGPDNKGSRFVFTLPV
jgi:signal transduction histidine kinase